MSNLNTAIQLVRATVVKEQLGLDHMKEIRQVITDAKDLAVRVQDLEKSNLSIQSQLQTHFDTLQSKLVKANGNGKLNHMKGIRQVITDAKVLATVMQNLVSSNLSTESQLQTHFDTLQSKLPN